MSTPTIEEIHALSQTASAAIADLADAVARMMRRAEVDRIVDISHAGAPSPTVGVPFDEPLPPAPWVGERHPCCRAVVGRGHLSDCAVGAIVGGGR